MCLICSMCEFEHLKKSEQKREDFGNNVKNWRPVEQRTSESSITLVVPYMLYNSLYLVKVITIKIKLMTQIKYPVEIKRMKYEY